MKKTILFNALFIFSLFSSPIFAAYGNKLNVVVGINKPPYIIKSNKSGFELDLIREILKRMGYAPHYIFAPNGRSINLLSKSGFDIAITINEDAVKDKNIYLSEPYIKYHNHAISLKSNNLKVEKIEDLSNYSVAGFNNARKMLGEVFNEMSKENERYTEITSQLAQAKMLIKDRVDFIVCDINIFNFMKDKIRHNRKFQYHSIFPLTEYRIASFDKLLIERFNEKLKEYKLEKDYQRLIKKYFKEK